MNHRQLSVLAGVSYLIIFFSAIYANFFVLDALKADPLGTVADSAQHVRFGALAFLIAAVFDVVVAFVLRELYRDHMFTPLSTYFRIMHATIMGLAVFALPLTLSMSSAAAISGQVHIFDLMCIIGLFFFGVHLILLGRIVKHIPFIPYMLMAAGVMYMIDTAAHIVLPNYDAYAGLMLTLVAIPSILGEMAFSLWLLFKEGEEKALKID